MDNIELFNKEIILKFDEKRHRYFNKGKVVPGATSILSMINKPGIMYWAINETVKHAIDKIPTDRPVSEKELKNILFDSKKAHKKTLELSAGIGTTAHEFAERYIAGKEVPLPANSEARLAAQAFLAWLRSKKKIEFLFSERKVYSKKYNYAGTVDFVARIDGRLVVGDFKTSKAIYPTSFYQTACYQQALSEEFPDLKFDGNIIVRIGKDGVYEERFTSNFDKNFKAFLAARTLYLRGKELDGEK